MTREIKFRMWAKSPDAWWIKSYGRMVYDYTSKILFENIGFSNHDEYEYMQFTGLLDKKRREIYEGDVIIYERIFNDCNPPLAYKYVNVVWYNEFGFIPFTESLRDSGPFSNVWGKDVEVVGNIYENPEILLQYKTTHVEVLSQ